VALSLRFYRAVEAFEVLAEEWNRLVHRSAADTIFLTLEYQRTWWRHLGEGELCILAVRDEEELVGIAPLFVTTDPDECRVLAFVGCVEVSDYLDFIVARDRGEDVYSVLADGLSGSDAPAWDVLDLCNIHQDSPTLEIWPRLAEARGWSVSIARDDVCPVVSLPDTWEEYLQMLEGKQRREIRRKLRRGSAQAALSWYIVGPDHDLRAEVDDFLDLMAASTPDKEAFLTPARRNFFHQLARVTYDAGWLQLAFLKVGQQKAAAYFNFVYDNRVLVYNSGLDWRAFPKLGAGIILTAYCIRHAIEQGREAFDFMRGDERYKYEFGGQDVEVRRLRVRRA